VQTGVARRSDPVNACKCICRSVRVRHVATDRVLMSRVGLNAGTCRQRRGTSPSTFRCMLIVSWRCVYSPCPGAPFWCLGGWMNHLHHCRPPRRLDDPKLCKNFLLGFCPAEEFQRTKHDYGTCTLDHDETAKAQVRKPQCIWLAAFALRQTRCACTSLCKILWPCWKSSRRWRLTSVPLCSHGTL
jgi:LUC7 N_terminus